VSAEASAILARSAMLRGFKEEAAAQGLDAVALAVEAGVDPAALVNPDLHVPAAAMAALYELAAERAGADDFALRVVARRRISNLGVVALLAREAPDLRQALRSVQRYLWVQNEAFDVSFEEFEAGVLIRGVPHIPLRKQVVDLSIGMLLVVVRHLIGGLWNPREIYLPYSAPASLARYYEVFRVRPHFDQDLAGVVIAKGDLDLRIPGADPDFVVQVRQHLEEATLNRRSGFIAGVRTLISQQLPHGDCDVDRIAAMLGLSRRSFQRQLAEHGSSFTALVDETRKFLVVPLLIDSGRSIQRVSDLLGFAKASSFNDWFKQRFGCSPTSYRAQKLAETPAK
jgi:AraC-like DNA-binding protein